MKYTTYIWREKRVTAYNHDYAAKISDCRVMCPLEETKRRYYVGMTSQHIEARLVTPRLGWVRDDVEVIWSKTYDNIEDASTVEDQCMNLLRSKTRGFRARCINQNANKRGWWGDQSKWPKYISIDLSKVEKITEKDIAQNSVDIPEWHKEWSQELIEKTQKKVFEDIENNAERLAKDSKVIQDMLAQYVKEHQTPKAKRAKTKSQWNIVNMKKAIKTLEQTLSAYKASMSRNKLATTT